MPSEVIGRSLKLQPKGRGEFTALCPFHKEKSPSFTVSDDKGFYHCFGCGEHGDVITFMMKYRSMDFADAVKYLAEEGGIPLPEPEYVDIEKEKKITSLHQVLSMASSWFHEQLYTPQGKPALDYLIKRGLSEETIKKFQLGYAPDTKNSLKNYLKSENISDELLNAAGLVVESEGRESIDRFRGRIIFPIHNLYGRVIAFGGRTLSDEVQPKYLNSPETEIFKKGHVLYGMHLAKEYARKNNLLIAVEGYMDVIALHAAGLPAAVAPLGTAMTENQLKLMWKFTEEPVMCLDGDAAGQRAMARVAEQNVSLLQPGLSIRFALLPEGQDPDDIIKSQGIGYIKKLVSSALPLSDVIWNIETNGKNIKTPEQIAQLEKKLGTIAETIQNQSVKNHYKTFFNQKIWDNFKRKNNKKAASKLPQAIVPELKQVAAMRMPNAMERAEYTIIKLVLEYPKLLAEPEIEEEFLRLDLSLNMLDKTRCSILELLTQQEGIGREALHSYLENQGLLPHIKAGSDLFEHKPLNESTDLEVAKTYWQYAIKNHTLLYLKQELEQTFHVEEEQFYERRQELQKQIFIAQEKLKSIAETIAEKEKQLQN